MKILSWLPRVGVILLEVMSLIGLWSLIHAPHMNPDDVQWFQIAAKSISAISILVLMPIMFRRSVFTGLITAVMIYGGQSLFFDTLAQSMNRHQLLQAEALMWNREAHPDDARLYKITSGFDDILIYQSLLGFEKMRIGVADEATQKWMHSEAEQQYMKISREISKRFSDLPKRFLLDAYQGRSKELIRSQNPFLVKYFDATLAPSIPLLGIPELKGEDLPLLLTQPQLEQRIRLHFSEHVWDKTHEEMARHAAMFFFLLPIGLLLSVFSLVGNLFCLLKQLFKQSGEMISGAV
jgi:hypothetical protein